MARERLCGRVSRALWEWHAAGPAALAANEFMYKPIRMGRPAHCRRRLLARPCRALCGEPPIQAVRRSSKGVSIPLLNTRVRESWGSGSAPAPTPQRERAMISFMISLAPP